MLTTIIVVAVLTLIGVAAVNRGSLEIEGMGVRHKYTMQAGCIEAARHLVLSQLALAGVTPAQFAISRVIGDLTVQTGHYDSEPGPGYVTVDSNAGNCGTGGTGAGAAGNLPGGIASSAWVAPANVPIYSGGGSGGGFAASSVCGVRVPVTCKDGAGRQLEVEFLVRMGL